MNISARYEIQATYNRDGAHMVVLRREPFSLEQQFVGTVASYDDAIKLITDDQRKRDPGTTVLLGVAEVRDA